MMKINNGGSPSEGKYNAIDLGLPSGTLWADKNVGAEQYHEVGLYFAWGETQGYTDPNEKINNGYSGFSFDTYKWSKNRTTTMTKYNAADSLRILESSDDAASVNMGLYDTNHTWVVPSKEQYDELFENTDSIPLYSEGQLCWKLTSKINGKEIIFPCAGYYAGTEKNYIGTQSLYYWINESLAISLMYPAGSYQYYSARYANMDEGSNYYTNYNQNRCYGLPIRAIVNINAQQ